MSNFADIPEGQQKTFKATEYVQLPTGVPIRLRILDKKALRQIKHYIPSARASVICAGEECPICQSNNRLMRENPGVNPREIKGFIPRQNRFLVNVLNRTVVKVSPSGKVIYPTGGQFPAVDPETGEPLVNIQAKALNKVQVLDRGPELYEQLNVLNAQITDETGNPLGLWTFNIGVTSTGVGRKTKTTVIPFANENDVVNVPEEDKYVLSTLGLILTAGEIETVLKGVSIKDIYAARRSTKENTGEEALVQLSEDVSNKVKDLFA